MQKNKNAGTTLGMPDNTERPGTSDQGEIKRRVEEANSVRKVGAPQRPNPRPNRVDSEFMEPLRDAAMSYWEDALLAYHKLTRAAIDAANNDQLSPKDRGGIISNATSFSPLIKHIAQFASGAVHPAGSNVKQEKLLAAEKVTAAKEKFAAREESALKKLKELQGTKPVDE